MKLKFIIALTVLLFFNSNIFSQIEYRHYKGKIGSFTVFMDLNFKNDTVKGKYYYQNIGNFLKLSGFIDQNNGFELVEINDDYDTTGIFNGNFLNDYNNLKGSWQNLEGTKFLNFDLNENYNHSCRLKYFKRNVRSTLAGFDEKPNITISLSYALPVTSPYRGSYNNLIKNIKKSFFQKEKGSYEKCIEFHIDEVIQNYNSTFSDKDTKDIKENSFFYNWDITNNTSVYFNENDYIVFLSDNYEYTGGAHGLLFFTGRIFDLKSGNIVTFDDIFLANTDEKLIDIILKKIDQAGKTKDLFSVEEVQVAEEFVINKNGIIFIYNVYEIAPYSAGPISVKISYKEIKNLLKNSFKIRMEVK